MLTPERALTKLQAVMRQPLPTDATKIRMTRRLPADLIAGQARHIGLGSEHVQAVDVVVTALQADLRFEHLKRASDDVWRFAASCWLERASNHVPAFVAEHARQPFALSCYMPVEYLTLQSAVEIYGIRLLPLDDTEIPSIPFLNLTSPIGAVASVNVEGTNFDLMASRARHLAEHALRLLRVALRGNVGINYDQLRFRLGRSYAFAGRASGWVQRDDAAYNLDLNDDTIKSVREHPTSTMPPYPSTGIEKQVDLAMRWMERAWFTGEPLVAVLYLFFALEAALGDKSAKLKAHELGLRQAMLDHVITGGFSHPSKMVFLYREVRSAAVHGEDMPEVTWKVARDFAWDVRLTINNYVTLANRQRLTSRSQLRRFLDEHPDRSELIAWLRANGSEEWSGYLDRVE